jgi:NADP-dependent aldehyde dehydrogenase
LILALAGEDLERFQVAAAEALKASAGATMLTRGIHDAFERGVAALEAHEAVDLVARGRIGEGPGQACGALFVTDAHRFLADPSLGHEVFGPSAVIVRCPSIEKIEAVLVRLEGQLTAALHFDGDDNLLAARLLPVLERKAGRILANGWPTGVEVAHAMVHGGPFPATSDGRSTSVGGLAINRFLRPVCYQSFPQELLPPELRDSNPWGVPRLVDGAPERANSR